MFFAGIYHVNSYSAFIPLECFSSFTLLGLLHPSMHCRISSLIENQFKTSVAGSWWYKISAIASEFRRIRSGRLSCLEKFRNHLRGLSQECAHPSSEFKGVQTSMILLPTPEASLTPNSISEEIESCEFDSLYLSLELSFDVPRFDCVKLLIIIQSTVLGFCISWVYVYELFKESFC